MSVSLEVTLNETSVVDIDRHIHSPFHHPIHTYTNTYTSLDCLSRGHDRTTIDIHFPPEVAQGIGHES